jgi:hypothetical protein
VLDPIGQRVSATGADAIDVIGSTELADFEFSDVGLAEFRELAKVVRQ